MLLVIVLLVLVVDFVDDADSLSSLHSEGLGLDLLDNDEGLLFFVQFQIHLLVIALIYDLHVLSFKVKLLPPDFVGAVVPQHLQVSAFRLEEVLGDHQIRRPIFSFG